MPLFCLEGVLPAAGGGPVLEYIDGRPPERPTACIPGMPHWEFYGGTPILFYREEDCSAASFLL